MADSLFKGPDQIKVGRDIQKKIQKRTETDPLEAVGRIVGAIAKGKGAELTRNMSRIETNLEDEKASLKNLFDRTTEHNEIIKSLTDLGDGDLREGIYRRELGDKGVLKRFSSLQGLKVSDNEKLYKSIKDQVESRYKFLTNKSKVMNRLYTKYDANDPNNIQEDILYDDIQDQTMFNKPYNTALYNIAIDQKDLGNNNLLDVLTRKEQRNNFNLTEKYLEEEERLNNIITATKAARKAVKLTAKDYDFEELLRSDDDGTQSSSQKKRDVEEKLNRFLGNSAAWGDLKDRPEDFADYFFPVTGERVNKLREQYNYSEDFEDFKKYYDYTDDDIREIFYDAATMINELENKAAIAYIDDNYVHAQLTKETSLSRRLGMLAEIWKTANYNINRVPRDLRQQVITGLEIKGYETELVDEDLLFEYSDIVDNIMEKVGGEYYNTLYNNLDAIDQDAFRINVLSNANYYKDNVTQGDFELAIKQAVLNQRFGLVENTGQGSWKEKIPFLSSDSFEYQTRLNWIDDTLHQEILIDHKEDAIITENRLREMLLDLNRNRIYWYKNDTLIDPNPQMWDDGQQATIGKHTIQFSKSPDEKGNRWTIVNN